MFELVFQYDPSQKDKTKRPADAEQARARLIEGNEQFSSLVIDGSLASQRLVVPANLEGLMGGEVGRTPAHQPFAAVLSCSDARVPPELLFHQTLNDLFVVRLAGNIIANESVGSLNYAAQHLGGSVKLLVVLGHSGCGAVSAAVDAYLGPANTPELTNTLGLRSVVDRIFIAVRTAAKALDSTKESLITDDESYRARLAGMSVVVNSAFAAMTLQQILGPSIPSDCQVVFGVYDLATRQVLGPEGPGLADPPSSFAELEELAVQVAGMDRW
jgi:carbonic anhydrase